jgi:integrase
MAWEDGVRTRDARRLMHVEKLPSGSWRVTVTHQGVRRRATMPTKREAERAGAGLLVALGAAPQVTDWTVGQLVDHQLAAADYAPTTLDGFRMAWARVPDGFKDQRVDRVTVSVLDALYARLAADGLTAHRVRKVHELLSVSLQRAVRWEWLASNPARNATPPTVRNAEVIPPPPDEVRRALALVDGQMLTYLRTAASTGARRGELCGLQWRDLIIDDTTRRVVIRRSVSYTPSSGVVVKDTKTGVRGHRVIGIDATTAQMLLEHQTSRTADLVALGLPWDPDRFVFSNTLGAGPWRPDYPTALLADLRKAHGLPSSVTIKNLRHFVATEMLGRGVPVTVVAGRLGHTTSATTTKVYAHFLPELDGSAADDHGDILDG